VVSLNLLDILAASSDNEAVVLLGDDDGLGDLGFLNIR
jgi:hypothetical protein